MVELKCPKCDSPAYLSRRRGLREGIISRFMGHAVFRCSHCGRRWSEHMPEAAFKKARRSESIVEYIGCGDTKNQQVLIRIVVIGLMVAILGAAFVGLSWNRVRVNEAGQHVPNPALNKMRARPLNQ